MNTPTLPRRTFLHAAGAAAITIPFSAPQSGAADPSPSPQQPKVAAIYTVCTHRSHAHVILENFLEPYLFNGKRVKPPVQVAALYADQSPEGDMTRQVAEKYKIPVFKTIAQALCLGGKDLAVDAVLSIGEHGDYPDNDLGQRQYPRKRFFDEITAVMQKSKRFMPLFNDKHLSYRWDWAKQMVDQSGKLGIPLMAGSSVPLAQRKPPLELAPDSPVTEAVSIHGGPLESYDFHALEVLQSLIESRAGGESGISSVEFLSGDALRKQTQKARWSFPLAQAAMAAERDAKPDDLWTVKGERTVEPHGLLLTYKDGLKAMVLKIGESSIRWNFACRLKDDPHIRATSFYPGPWQNRNLFKALSHAIQHHFVHREAPYPVERTLLATGVLEAAMRSRKMGKLLATPHLEFAYPARDFTAMREMGASWKIITEDTPQPKGVNPGG